MTRSVIAKTKWLLVIAGLIPAGMTAFSARAQCTQWDIAGTAVQLDQSAGGYAVFDLSLDGENVSGTARTGRAEGNAEYLLGMLVRGGDYATAQGTVDGVFSGDNLELQVRWSDGKKGMYDIDIDARGRLTGQTYDFNRPSSRANVIGVQRLACAVSSQPRRPAPGASPGSDSSGSARSGTVRRLGKGPAPASGPVARRLGKRSVADVANATTGRQVACRGGYVTRQAGPDDTVCVSPDSRNRAAGENRTAASRWVVGPFGPRTCKAGFVWREAFSGDNVCVVPGVRALVNMENRLASSRRLQ